MKEQTNEELSQDLFIADVQSWGLMESEALGFLNEGEIEGLRQTATAFIFIINFSHGDGRNNKAM